MGGSSSTAVCSVCQAVPTSPCVLSCKHSFCLKCLEEKVGGHKKVILCPVCNSSSEMPAGGVRDLAEGHMMCHVHGEERVIFQCRQCDQVICIRCKLTRHEGHFTQDLSEVAAEGKEKIKKELPRLRACIKNMEQKVMILEEREKFVRDKQRGHGRGHGTRMPGRVTEETQHLIQPAE
ncbi:hypothetical protein C0Q70_03429 [Pomacea canaliculata]|uniref:RING-type domain-containing protein n=1 Tax=Pomacea canaliculata TaxID=400727 RepID=A0A2T7PSQ2_POMCA|nr:hypothetical protein C0Q70_03429 [Pomacea canaliculata]